MIRIGGVHYGVGAPLLVGLDDRPGVEVVRDTPRRLITELRQGRLDAALASSIEAFRVPGYRTVRHLGIACRGPARSVRAFLRCPPADVRSVGLDDGSESSVALLKILLHRNGAKPDSFERIQPTQQPDTLPHDAVLLIGDAGFRADPGNRTVLDLGAAWFEWTQLPFVFALWLISEHADADSLLPLFEIGYVEPTSQVGDFNEAIHYRLQHRDMEGLHRFHQEASTIDLCDPDIHPTILGSDDPGYWQ